MRYDDEHRPRPHPELDSVESVPPPEGGPRIHRRQVEQAAGVGLLILALGITWLWFAPCWMGGCAPITDLEEFQVEGSVLLDVNGDPFGTLATVNRRIVTLDSLPPHIPQAFLAVEDQRFYRHGGVDVRRMVAAFINTTRSILGLGGGLEGGSTLTMQLARNLFPERLPYTEQTLFRKIKEIRIARQLEREFTKDKILELYLNHIYLGSGAYGIEAAAQTYFAKPASELTLAEAATLAALPKAPSELSPRESPDAALERRNLVLRLMAEAGYISAAGANAAIEEPLELAEPRQVDGGLAGSYFIERVRRELEAILGNRFYTDGLRVHTTLDPVAQAAAEEELAQQLDAIESGRYGVLRHETYPEAAGDGRGTGETPYLQGAVIVMEASTGAVRALVGGRDFEDSKFDRATQARRQPGSAFKPFVYVTAIERFGSPLRIVQDEPVRLVLSGGRVWEPENYRDRYDGPITLREALTRSKNVATVRLAQDLGMGAVIDNAREMGIGTAIPHVPAAALGAATVRPIALVAAYAPFANGGLRVEPYFIRSVEDRDGRVLWQAELERDRVLDPAVAFVMTTLLQDVIDRGTGTAARASGFRGPAAGKTGTTNDAADVWFIGYTPELVAGVWIGMDEPQTIVRGASGGTLAAPVWGRMMERIYADRPMPPRWQPPPGVVTAEVERETGMVVDESCPAFGPTYTEYFVRSVPQRAVCRRVYGDGRRLAGDGWWGDEEWDTVGAYGAGDSVAAELRRQGIYWPELEDIREDSLAEDSNPLYEWEEGETGDTVYGDTIYDDTMYSDTIAPLPMDTAPFADTAGVDTLADTIPDEPPELLGEPVRSDTAGEPPGA